MAAQLEVEFKALVVQTLGEDAGKAIKWLTAEGLLSAEDFGLLATDEREVTDVVLPAAKAKGVPTEELKHKVAFKKLWKLCRKEEVSYAGLADSTEADTGLCDKTRKSCEGLWRGRHSFTLPAGRMLVSTQMRPMYEMSHTVSPHPRDFSLLPLKRMKLQDGSVGAGSSDADVGSVHIIFLKLRAFFYSYAFVNVDNHTWFDYGAAEAMVDRLLGFLYMRHAAGRPPVKFYSEAWDATARVFQKSVRAGKTLTETTEADGTYQHIWSQYVREASDPAPRGGGQDVQREKGNNCNGKQKKSDSGYDNRLAQMQRAKDQQISVLKRELEQKGGGGPVPKRGNWAKKW